MVEALDSCSDGVTDACHCRSHKHAGPPQPTLACDCRTNHLSRTVLDRLRTVAERGSRIMVLGVYAPANTSDADDSVLSV